MNRWVKFILAIALGLILGLVYGWIISPIEYVDTTPVTLRYDYRTDYVLMVSEIYDSKQDVSQAARQLARLTSDPPVDFVLQSMAYGNQMGYPLEDLSLLQNLATALQSWKSNPGEFNP